MPQSRLSALGRIPRGVWALGWVVAARFADRVGKGIRGAPRDALIADLTPADLRGTGFGVFNLGIALLVASVLAGWLWDTFGPGLTFYAGAAFTLIAWIGLARYGGGATELKRA